MIKIDLNKPKVPQLKKSIGEYKLNCFFTSTTQFKELKKKVEADIEISINGGVQISY